MTDTRRQREFRLRCSANSDLMTESRQGCATIIAAVIAGIGLRIDRGRSFSSKDEFNQATEQFKKNAEAKAKR